MRPEQIIFSFKSTGFTEYEAKVYLALLGRHPATAYALSRSSGVPHSRIYDIARRLIKKGVVIRIDSNPERFSPLSPEELVAKLRRDTGRHIGALEKSLRAVRFQPDFDPVWNITERSEALQIAGRLFEGAGKRLYLGAWDPEIHELTDGLKEAENRGVEVFLLIYGEAEPGIGTSYHHSTDALSSRFGVSIDCTVDSEVCISGYLGGEEPCKVVWTRNRGLVQSIEEYIIHDLYLAELQDAFGDEITERYGRNLSVLRGKFRREIAAP